jgi:hypothetical protein
MPEFAAAAISLALCSTAVAAILRWARCPGWALVGGMLAGVLLGPSIFGRIAPLSYERWFVGGVEQRQQLDSLRSRQGADLAAAQLARLGVEAARELRRGHAAELTAAERELALARHRDQRPMRTAVMALAASVLLGGASRRSRARQPIAWLTPLSIGVWSAALPGAAALLLMTLAWNQAPLSAHIVAAAVAIGPWMTSQLDEQAADAAEIGGAATMQLAGRIASLLAIAAALGAARVFGGPSLLLAMSPALALPLSWLLAAVAPLRHAALAALQQHLLLPMLAAAVAVRVDLFAHFDLWPIVLLMLLSGDGRWLGAMAGALVPGGRSPLRTMRLVLGSMSCGPTQLVVSALALWNGIIQERFAFGLLAGAALIEVLGPARRAIAHKLVQAERDTQRSPDRR